MHMVAVSKNTIWIFMTVNTELLFKGNNRDVADVQEIQASVANCMYHFNEQGDSAFCPQKLWTCFPRFSQ